MYAYLHDVLVKEEYRGRGYGRQLMMGVLVALQEYADDTCKSIKLQFTSSPTRVAANSLYQSLGFELVATATSGGTNLYQRIIESAM